MQPKLTKVIRLDSMPLSQTYFTPEGYLKDTPILTSTGIFEYSNPDGSVRRELRLPEDVFEKESLESYKGKPIIITHDAGLIDKENVSENTIGTILSEGRKDGNDVRADIIIHDTDEMKRYGLKELSLGYSLDLDETPGEWKGQHYDSVQKNIRINHLALVREARAGEQARLNIDSRDKSSILKGGKKQMSVSKKTRKNTRRADGVLSQEEFSKAIEEYKTRRAARMAKKADEDDTAVEEKVVDTKPVKADEEETKVPETAEDKVAFVKDRRDRRDEEGDPETNEEALDVIAHQDEDIEILFDIIDTLLAEKEFGKDCGTGENCDEDEVPAEGEKTETDGEDEPDEGEEIAEDEEDEELAKDGDEEDETLTEDEDDEEIVEDEDDEELTEDEDDDDIPSAEGKLNTDSVDRIVRERIQIGIAGDALHLKGLERLSPKAAKKKIIKAVRPSINLDGKSSAFINACFDMVCEEVRKSSRKDTKFQKKQMFNKDSRSVSRSDSAEAARNRMIKRQNKSK